jgi:hypothetical protein
MTFASCNQETTVINLHLPQISTSSPFSTQLFVGTEVKWLNKNSVLDTVLSPEGENPDTARGAHGKDSLHQELKLLTQAE